MQSLLTKANKTAASIACALLFFACSAFSASAPIDKSPPMPLVESPALPLEGIDPSTVPPDSSGSRISFPAELDDPYFNPDPTRFLSAHFPDSPFYLSPRPKPEPPQPSTPSGSETSGVRDPIPAVLPESEKADASYFADALFIGDSRTAGLSLYSGIASTYYADTGLNVLTALSKAFLTVKQDGVSRPATILDAVSLSPTYKKVYIAFGINEIGWPSSATFIGTYEYLLAELQKLLPDAVFYLQGIIPVSQAVEDSGYIKNDRVAEYNALLAELAERYGAGFIDLTGLYEEAGGVLTSDISSDGIHLNRKGVEAYMDWLLRHTVAVS